MIYNKLYDWQKKVIDNFKDRDSFGLFVDMGLGKTPMSLAFAEQNKCTKILIITINSKALESEEIGGSWLNWAKQLPLDYSFINKKSSYPFRNVPSIMLTNYESLFSRSQDRKAKVVLKEHITEFIKICEKENVAIIVDESHKMKNLQSLQTSAIFKIKKELQLKKCKVFTYLLTGTPFTTSYVDLYSQLKMLGWDETKTYFINEFCVRGNLPGLLGYQQPIIGYKNLGELYDIIHEFGITMKSEDVVELPEKVFVDHVIKESNEFKLFTNEMYRDFEINKELKKRDLDLITEKNIKVNNPFYRNFSYPDFNYMADTSGSFWLRCRQMSIGFQGNAEDYKWYNKDRLNSLADFLRKNEDNYVLFYNYTPELVYLFNICEECGYLIDVYCGEIKSLNYYNEYHEFSDSEKLVNKKRIILANFVSGGTGMNWQDYNKCIIFSIPLYKDYEQALKRVHRLGQKQTVIYHTFYQDNWLDKSMIKSLRESQDYSSQMFESDLKRVKSMMED